jgi:hypothetical protein
MLPSVVAHVYNLNYLGGRDREDGDSRPVREKNLKDPIPNNGWVWWHVPVIPVPQEA